jgi:hypothetical protein
MSDAEKTESILRETIKIQQDRIIELASRIDSLDRLLVHAEETKRDTQSKLQRCFESRYADVWVKAWNSVASASNCKEPSPNAATYWADCCLEAYKARFGEGKL